MYPYSTEFTSLFSLFRDNFTLRKVHISRHKYPTPVVHTHFSTALLPLSTSLPSISQPPFDTALPTKGGTTRRGRQEEAYHGGGVVMGRGQEARSLTLVAGGDTSTSVEASDGSGGDW